MTAMALADSVAAALRRAGGQVDLRAGDLNLCPLPADATHVYANDHSFTAALRLRVLGECARLQRLRQLVATQGPSVRATAPLVSGSRARARDSLSRTR